MKQHLTELFKYNDWANRRVLDSIKQLPHKEEAARLFSHLISAQNKWINRLTKEADDETIQWFGETLPIEELEEKWSESVNKWINLLECNDIGFLGTTVTFYAKVTNKNLKVTLQDLMLQLNYHSMHHRAQINTIISREGLTPPATDYILTRVKEA